MTKPRKRACADCLAGQCGPCPEDACPFWSEIASQQAGRADRSETRPVGELCHEISAWEQERLRREHDSLYCIVYGGVLLLAALFAALFLTVAGVTWGGD